MSRVSLLRRLCATCLFVQNDGSDVVGVGDEGVKLGQLEHLALLVVAVVTDLGKAGLGSDGAVFGSDGAAFRFDGAVFGTDGVGFRSDAAAFRSDGRFLGLKGRFLSLMDRTVIEIRKSAAFYEILRVSL